MGRPPAEAGGHRIGKFRRNLPMREKRCGVLRMAIRPKRQYTISARRPDPVLKLGGDFLLCPLRLNFDLPRLGLFGDRNPQRQDTGVVRSLYILSIQGVPED
jgi:hypothetical protein